MIRSETFALPHYGRHENAEEITSRIARMLHPMAQAEFHRDGGTVELIQLWLRKRLERFEIDRSNNGTVSLTLNPYNDSDGFGLQSVSVALLEQVYSEGPLEEVLSNNEWKSPTVGVIADGMVKPPFQMAEARFGIDRGKGESIESCSGNLQIDGEQEGDIQPLKPGNSILVKGPRAVRTYLQMRDASPEQVREVINRGVYIRRFIRTGGQRLIDDTDTTAIIE